MPHHLVLAGTLNLYLVRHGESEGNRRRILQGQGDFPLTEEGRRQAAALAAELGAEAVRPDRIWSSDLSRASETAEILAKGLGGGPVKLLRSLREVCFGRFEGMTLAELGSREPEVMAAVDEGRSLGEFDPEAEDYPAAHARARRAIQAITRAHSGGGTIVAVTHGALLQSIIKALLGIPWRRKAFFAAPNASCTHVEVTGATVRLHTLARRTWKTGQKEQR